MSGLLISVVSFVVIISLLVIIHELGHFLTAKYFKVGVKEFGVGIPPRLWSKKIGETTYAVNALPLGGYVRMVGEDKEENDTDASFNRKGPFARLIILLAGSLSHIVLAFIIFGVFALINGEAVPTGKVLVHEVNPDSPAATAGMVSGDVIIAVNNAALSDSHDFIEQVKGAAGEEIDLTILREEQYVYLSLIPRVDPPAGQGALGVSVSTDFTVRRVGPLRAGIIGIQTTGTVVIETLRALVRLGGDLLLRTKVPTDLSGPVGIAAISGEVAQSQGIPGLFILMAVLAANLAVFNLLPIPALDGGRIIFVLLEIVRGGKKIPVEKEAMVHAIGIAALLMLIVLITYKDVLRILGW